MVLQRATIDDIAIINRLYVFVTNNMALNDSKIKNNIYKMTTDK